MAVWRDRIQSVQASASATVNLIPGWMLLALLLQCKCCLRPAAVMIIMMRASCEQNLRRLCIYTRPPTLVYITAFGLLRQQVDKPELGVPFFWPFGPRTSFQFCDSHTKRSAKTLDNPPNTAENNPRTSFQFCDSHTKRCENSG